MTVHDAGRTCAILLENAPSDVARERCVSYRPSDEDPGTGALNSHPHLRRQTSPSLGIMWVVMLWCCVEFSRVASVAVTVTLLRPALAEWIWSTWSMPSIHHDVPPNVPQGYCLASIHRLVGRVSASEHENALA